MIRAAAAIDSKRGIADQHGMPWRLPAEHRHFRDLTQGSTVLMGYNTYKKFKRPLRNRRNIVWCREGTELRDGFEPMYNVDDFLESTVDDVWIIGGQKLYEATLKYCQELYLTAIDADYHCTKFFPEFASRFDLVESRATTEANTAYSYQKWSVRN